MNVLAVIMARAGSVGLPGKALRELLGRPVIAYTFDHAREAKRVGKIVVSTDDVGVMALARAEGLELIHRPPELATSTSATDPVLRHAVVEVARREPYLPDVVVMLYGNVPVREGGMIDKCIKMLERTGCDSVQTIAPVGKMHPYWMFDLDGEGRIKKHVANDVFRRQDLPALYSPTGAVYVMKTSVLMGSEGKSDPHAFLGKDRRGLVVGAEDSVDIDSARDLFLAEAVLRETQNSKLKTQNKERQPGESKVIEIGGKKVSRNGTPFVMAEIGVNHDGDVEVARQLVHAAKEAGADGVKFQLFEAGRLLAKEAGLVEYQKSSAGSAEELLGNLELPAEGMKEMVRLAHELGMAAVITPFSCELVKVAAECGCDAIKLASPDLVNRPLVEAAVATGLPLILSTGGAEIEEICEAMEWLGDARQRTVVLQCVSSYPTEPQDASLGGVRVLRFALNDMAIGYSDHTTLAWTGALAVSAGACLLEKHLTLDKKRKGPDHAASLEPAEMAEYVRLARAAFNMRGPMEKRVLEAEKEVHKQTRQSVAAAVDLKAGTILTRDMLTTKRPGTGIPAARLGELLGKSVIRNVAAGALVKAEDLGGGGK